ncbi:MAG TPA: hypothetical protein VHZ24_05275 [Pirellulales bacterium]|nr:hypothetical protein [Pirellulales bacterium]
MNSSRLPHLRSRLRVLRWRQFARWLAASATITAALLLVGMLAVFVLDWSLDLAPIARAVLIMLVAGCAVAVLPRLIDLRQRRPAGDIALALAVEHRQGLDNDLVAALQFDSAAGDVWGSPRLASAVIDYVDDFSQHLEVEPPADRASLRRLLLPLLLMAAIVAAIALRWPDYLGALADRLLLGHAPYPCNTVLERLLVDGQLVGIAPEPSPAELRKPLGATIDFELHASGVLPAAGFIELAGVGDSRPSTIDLQRDAQRPGVYVARLPRLVEDAQFQVHLGDARTHERWLRVIALPAISVAFDVSAPDYAAARGTESREVAGSRQLTVVEGSTIGIHVTSAGKRLTGATVKLGGTELPLTATDSTGLHWTLATRGGALEAVRGPVRYEVQVADEDGLHLAEPVVGMIGVRRDHPPQVIASSVTQHVLPTGKPRLTFEASDDFGIARLRVRRQIQHEDGSTASDLVEIPRGTAAAERVLQGRYALDLSGLKLIKGDQLRVTVEATDARGRKPGKLGVSEPLVFHVTDERGVLGAMAETDQRTAKQMDDIIERQLGIGKE